MERISVFDIFKIGIGPSSSHTMGPWKASLLFIEVLKSGEPFENIESIDVELYGSLAKTGKGHGTDIAIILGLSGFIPAEVNPKSIDQSILTVQENKKLNLNHELVIPFDPETQIHFFFDQVLPFHSNGILFRAYYKNGTSISQTYFSVGGGFVIQEGEVANHSNYELPYPIDSANDLKNWCSELSLSVSEVVMKNELSIRDKKEIETGLLEIWNVMKECIFISCKKSGILPGGLNVQRRAFGISNKLLSGVQYDDIDSWIKAIGNDRSDFRRTLSWVGCFALAVNEENAAFGRVVTAPTNGAAGVIPAVLLYHLCFSTEFKEEHITQFLLTAGEIGSIFKKGATISAAMGGCQAEIGVSSAMAAAALTECLGGSYDQVLMAAEIAMEHHLGLTCDPIGGLVQIPCIERNTMGAVKAIMACQIALESDPDKALVSLDGVIKTMKETAADMNTKYKETSDGGLAIHIPVNIVEC